MPRATNVAVVAADADPYLTSAETAAMIGISPKTLRNWRCFGKGPKPILLGSVGGRVHYRRSEVDTYLSVGAAHGVVPGAHDCAPSARMGRRLETEGVV
ncbi:helix-turn-helix transcriptional regulator [Streptomyces sp. NPDC058525]|uniref:helix-turn-helix transcriptional regulator n=1 Tax=Streptomyces sp. NPDC058525 TaxID=3346538 RepID=UPI00365E8FDF